VHRVFQHGQHEAVLRTRDDPAASEIVELGWHHDLRNEPDRPVVILVFDRRA
jgi:hypothetical protein